MIPYFSDVDCINLLAIVAWLSPLISLSLALSSLYLAFLNAAHTKN